MEEGVHLFVEQRNVQSVQVFEVIVTTLIARRLVTIKEIVVERDADGLQTIHGQLHGEAFTGRGLTTAAGTCYKYHLDGLPRGNLIGYLGYFLLLQGLTKLNELVATSFDNGIIQVTNSTHTQNSLPTMMLLEDLEHLVLADKCTKLRGILL